MYLLITFTIKLVINLIKIKNFSFPNVPTQLSRPERVNTIQSYSHIPFNSLFIKIIISFFLRGSIYCCRHLQPKIKASIQKDHCQVLVFVMLILR